MDAAFERAVHVASERKKFVQLGSQLNSLTESAAGAFGTYMYLYILSVQSNLTTAPF